MTWTWVSYRPTGQFLLSMSFSLRHRYHFHYEIRMQKPTPFGDTITFHSYGYLLFHLHVILTVIFKNQIHISKGYIIRCTRNHMLFVYLLLPPFISKEQSPGSRLHWQELVKKLYLNHCGKFIFLRHHFIRCCREIKTPHLWCKCLTWTSTWIFYWCYITACLIFNLNA